MSISPADFKRIKEHLAQFPQQSPCPVCAGRRWSVAGLETGAAFSEEGISLGGGTVPMVIVVCATCYFVRKFAWIPIRDGEDQREEGTK